MERADHCPSSREKTFLGHEVDGPVRGCCVQVCVLSLHIGTWQGQVLLKSRLLHSPSHTHGKRHDIKSGTFLPPSRAPSEQQLPSACVFSSLAMKPRQAPRGLAPPAGSVGSGGKGLTGLRSWNCRRGPPLVGP